MKSLKALGLALGVIALSMTLVSTAIAGGAEDINYRQKIMKAVGGHMGAMASIAKGKSGRPSDFAGHAHAMAELAKISIHVFPKGSGPSAGKTGVLDTVWQKPDEFKAVAKAFVTESAKLAKFAKRGDLKAAGKQLGALGKNACKACHDSFQQKKK